MWTIYAPAITAAFMASLVEVVEAFTIVLVVTTVRGWRPALAGAAAGLAVLVIIVVVLGPLLSDVPIQGLRLAMGVLLLLFGLRWLRKAILRAAGRIPLHDEGKAFTKGAEAMRIQVAQGRHLDWLAGLTAGKAVFVEGLEVVFIVLAVGAGQGLIVPASLGALAACVVVLLVGLVIRRPLERVPENTLKFAVGVMLSAFGVFWCGEGLDVVWPLADLSILAIGVAFLATALVLVRLAAVPNRQVV